MLEVRTAIVMEGFGAAIAVEEIVFVVFVAGAETSSNMGAPSSFFPAVAAAVISYMVWVRFIFRLEQSVLVTGLPFSVLSYFLFFGFSPFLSHFRTDAAVSYDKADEEIALSVAGGEELFS